jgi:uncharacterized protein
MKKVESRMPNENAPRRVLHYFFILTSSFCILLVRLYKLTLSPLIAFLAGPSGACRFEPSCSQYAIDALKTHGAVHGSWLATKRICRCHPWSHESGADPVPPIAVKTIDLVSEQFSNATGGGASVLASRLSQSVRAGARPESRPTRNSHFLAPRSAFRAPHS